MDESWRARRAAGDGWNAAALDDAGWEKAQPLAAGASQGGGGNGLPQIPPQDAAKSLAELAGAFGAVASTAAQRGGVRAALGAADPLQVALDRPNREIIVPARANAATTLQALELTNGATLDNRLQKLSARLVPRAAENPVKWIGELYGHALGRPPSEAERELAAELLSTPVKPEGVADLLWVVVNLPEFVLIR
jgi:hypothetical protein